MSKEKSELIEIAIVMAGFLVIIGFMVAAVVLDGRSV